MNCAGQEAGFCRAAVKKGYVEIRRGDPVFYKFTQADGSLCDRIYTKVSHGAGNDISDSLLAKMCVQMRFMRKEEFMQFIDCTFSEAEYREMLLYLTPSDKFW